MASWAPEKDPCKAANCTASASDDPMQYPMGLPGVRDSATKGQLCQWEGISCRYPHKVKPEMLYFDAHHISKWVHQAPTCGSKSPHDIQLPNLVRPQLCCLPVLELHVLPAVSGIESHQMTQSLSVCELRRNWRVTGVKLGCGPNDTLCPHVQGSLPPAMGNLTELCILDMQVPHLPRTAA